ncbi:hypothetical protein F5Y17DRAFT_458937 [Xylariaceae sp. FL0594]|nr:hypothetical protein F5Y17DRAFT_458937 [Xylariaceae sp. FL0594]
MPLNLRELTTEAEFQRVVDVELEAYSKPFNGFWDLLVGASQAGWRARQWSWHTSDPSSRWVYVTDDATGDVIGATNWNIYDTKSPWVEEEGGGGEPAMTAYRLEGPRKNVGDQLFASFFGNRPKLMNKPHLLISYYCVHALHRRRGAARMMLQWGIDKADELGLDCFVESTHDGRPAYESAGFRVIGELYLDATTDEPDEGFEAAKREYGVPLTGWIMKRDAVARKQEDGN